MADTAGTSSKYGLACDNLVSAEVVLADGRVVRASEREHADLFWGIRGGSGNFGIVTEFEFRLHPLGPTVLAGLMVFGVDRAPEVLRRWRDWADGAPDEVSTGCAVITAPPEPFVPVHLHGRPVLGIPVLYAGDPEDGAAAVQPLRELGPAVDHVGPMPYTAFQAVLDPLAPPGWRSYARGEYMPGFSDAAIDTFLAHAAGLTALGAPLSQMIVFRIGQAVAAVPDEATAFSHRDARYLFHPISIWADPADDERMIAANRAFTAADAAVWYRRRLPQLHAGGRPGPGRLRRRHVRPPGGAQGPLRSGQPVPPQPEHPAEPARRRAGSGLAIRPPSPAARWP